MQEFAYIYLVWHEAEEQADRLIDKPNSTVHTEWAPFVQTVYQEASTIQEADAELELLSYPSFYL